LKNNSFDLVLEDEVSIVDLLVNTKFIESKTSARRFLKENAISLNMEKIKEDYLVTKKDVINGIILLQRGKKTFKLIKTS
jgi:tyrosyl-tRNA synthetase